MLYYVDYLCVHSRHRKKGIAPKTIYSHYVNHRYKHNNVIFLCRLCHVIFDKGYLSVFNKKVSKLFIKLLAL